MGRKKSATETLIYGAVTCAVVGTTYYALLGCGCGNQGPSYHLDYQVPNGVVATPGVVIESEEGAYFRLDANQPFTSPFWTQCLYPTVENYGDNERAGARRVRVFYPGLQQPLHGVLALCKIENDFKGAASRSYRVEVPQARVDATDGGRMSYVVEEYDIKGKTFPAWSLWLSREPIPRR